MKILNAERRYDIDWLRVIAIGLLLVYHIGIGFQPWGVFIQFIQNDKPLESLWIPMSMLNIWRIPLLFFISGMGVCFAIIKRGWQQLLLERTRRIFLPFLFGIFFIVPVHTYIWQQYYMQDAIYSPNPGHLWFLGNIFIYVIILAPVFYYLKSFEQGRARRWITKLLSNPLGLLLIGGTFMIESIWIGPEIFEAYAMSLHGFTMGLLAFFYGFILIYSGHDVWRTLLKWRWAILFAAFTIFSIRLLVFDLKAPNYLLALESCTWIFAIFGLAYKYLNHPGKVLKYLSEAVYPIYIIHMVFLYLGSYLLMPLLIPAGFKLLMVIAFTGIGCFTFYELLIRRIGFLRPLFGLKIQYRKTKAMCGQRKSGVASETDIEMETGSVSLERRGLNPG